MTEDIDLFNLKNLKDKDVLMFGDSVILGSTLGESFTTVLKEICSCSGIPAESSSVFLKEISEKIHYEIRRKGTSLDISREGVLFKNGHPCKALKVGTGEWQEGYIRFDIKVTAEFIPADPGNTIDRPTESSLDDFREIS